ncbi:MAG: porin family protein [Alphaproteobacteria bacterium]|nr:porin family protein [Alphaproteobacteria bacterium]
MRKLFIVCGLLVGAPAFAYQSPYYGDYQPNSLNDYYTRAPQQDYYQQATKATQKTITPETRDGFIGLKLQKSLGIHFGGEDSQMKGEKPFGISASLGSRINPYASIEGEIQAAGGMWAETSLARAEVAAYSIMFNGYFDYEIVPGFSPYVGAGLGLGIINTAVKVELLDIDDSMTTMGLSYQIMFGLNVALSDRFGLNIGFRYQDFGEGESTLVGEKAKMEGTNKAFYAGVAYKFGWK